MHVKSLPVVVALAGLLGIYLESSQLTAAEALPTASAVWVTGEIVDSHSHLAVAGRLYIQNEGGTAFFAESSGTNGSAVPYNRQGGGNLKAVERYTSLSAHPFRVKLSPGHYRFTVERGKEFLPLIRELEVRETSIHLRLELQRFVDMSARGWFSGDTHVHRDPSELATAALAEDLNVVHPITAWTTESEVSPSRSGRSMKGVFKAAPSVLDATHVIYPLNSEYEIFQTGRRAHTLGAFVIVNQREPIDLPVFPWRAVAAKVRAQGGLIDFEKHNWEWTPALAAVVQPDLFELANNHLWRTEYGVTNWAVPAPAWMQVGTGGQSARNWALYGFQTYYAFLNCGFHPRPTAGTAHGVHPVPLGYGRVYVHLDHGFNYDDWMRGLNDGRSFVTTGPLVIAEVEGRDPGHRFSWKKPSARTVSVKGEIFSANPGGAVIEVIVNGEVQLMRKLESSAQSLQRHSWKFRESVTVPQSGWMVVRCWTTKPSGEVEFAHSAPWWIDLGGVPPRPWRREVEWLASRVRAEIARNQAVLTEDQLTEYREALAVYERLLVGAQSNPSE